MAIYRYKALALETDVSDRDPKHLKHLLPGVLVADSPRHARELLRAQGMVVTQLELSGTLNHWRHRLLQPRGVSRMQLTQWYRELATLLAAGVSLPDSLEACLRQSNGRLRRLLLTLKEQVCRGVSLADAMAEQPAAFDPIAMSLVRVGERAGTLEQVLQQLADFRGRADTLRNRLVNALIYPVLVLGMAVGVTLLLMTFVVPNILQPLIESGRPLPWITTVVKAASDGLLSYGWLLALATVGLAVGGFVLCRMERIRRCIDGWLLKLPLLGELIRRQAVVRVCMVIATLMQSGVDFLEAIEIAGGVVKNRAIREGLQEVGQAVGRGQDIADALETTQMFSPAVVQVFRVGQQTGQLENLLLQLADDYDQQSQWAAQRLTAALEPVLILVLAILIGFIAFATILPILEAGHVL